MKYARHRSRLSSGSKRRTRKRKKNGGNFKKTFFMLLIGMGIGIFGYSQFDSSEKISQFATEFQEDVIFGLSEGGDASAKMDEQGDAVVEMPSVQEIRISGPHGGTSIARRGEEGAEFVHVIVAELPNIDTTREFYEGWLVKPGVTDFFSTGELEQRADGKWALVWKEKMKVVEHDIFDFNQVVVTREPRDGNASPSPVHVLKGKFE